jgi:hypothetical protein
MMNCTCGVGDTRTGQHEPWCYLIWLRASPHKVPQTHDAMITATQQLAIDMERSAKAMMRASWAAAQDGDGRGSDRQQCIATREYEWAARAWLAVGDPGAARRCAEMAASIRFGQWVEPTGDSV